MSNYNTYLNSLQPHSNRYKNHNQSVNKSLECHDNKSFSQLNKFDISKGLTKIILTLTKMIIRPKIECFLRIWQYSEQIPFDVVYRKKIRLHLFKLISIFHERYEVNMQMTFKQLRIHCVKNRIVHNYESKLNRSMFRQVVLMMKSKKYFQALVNSSKKIKSIFNQVRIRDFMFKCESLLTKKFIKKNLLIKFREWHLQTIIQKLKNLGNQQSFYMSKRNIISISVLCYILNNKLRIGFEKLKANENYPISTKKLRKKLKFCRIINNFHTKRILYHYPNISSSYDDDAKIYLYLKSLFLERLRLNNCILGFENNKSQGIYFLNKIILRRLTSAKEASFTILLKFSSQNSSKKIKFFANETQKASLIRLQRIFKDKLKLNLSDFFSRIIYLRKDDKLIHNKDLISIKLKNLARLLERKPLINEEETSKLSAFKMCKSFFFINHKNKIFLTPEKKIVINILFNILKVKYNAHILQTFLKIKIQPPKIAFPLEKPKALKVNYNSNNVINKNTIMNQSVVNAKLDKKYKKRHIKICELLRSEKILNIWDKNYKINGSLMYYFERWKNKLCFEPHKINEYKNLLNILESENDIIAAEVQQLEQLLSENQNNMNSSKVNGELQEIDTESLIKFDSKLCFNEEELKLSLSTWMRSGAPEVEESENRVIHLSFLEKKNLELINSINQNEEILNEEYELYTEKILKLKEQIERSKKG